MLLYFMSMNTAHHLNLHLLQTNHKDHLQVLTIFITTGPVVLV